MKLLITKHAKQRALIRCGITEEYIQTLWDKAEPFGVPRDNGGIPYKARHYTLVVRKEGKHYLLLTIWDNNRDQTGKNQTWSHRKTKQRSGRNHVIYLGKDIDNYM